MENIVEAFVRKVSKDTGSTYLKEANAQKIKQEFGVDVPVDKSSRRYDFVIKHNEKIYLIETNYYGGGGSKLKSTAGEYRNLQDKLDNKFIFIWITDGLGWHTTTHPLRETFDNNDIILNLKLLELGLLNHILE
jgi:type II restriction enzyme